MLKNTDKTIKIISPAKVNLFLAVGEKSGNFHPVLNVMHSLLLHDVIFMNYEKSDDLKVKIEFLENEDSDGQTPQIAPKDNLIYHAIFELAKKTKNSKYKIDVFVEKNIPMQAGLAGGSSNAAAAIVGAAKIFGISDDEVLMNAAQNVGSDVAFFLNGGCALYKDRGQILDHKISPMNREILLVKPFGDEGLSTKEVYKNFDKMALAADLNSPFSGEVHDCDDEDCHAHEEQLSLTEAASQLQYADEVPLFNNLSPVSESMMPDLHEIREWLTKKCGDENVLLCGSGSATFCYVPDSIDAATLEEEAKNKGYWTKTTQLANVRTRIVPNVTEY